MINQEENYQIMTMSTNIPIGGLLLLLDKFVEYEIGTKQKQCIK